MQTKTTSVQSLPVKGLRKLASELKIKNPSSYRREKLIQLILEMEESKTKTTTKVKAKEKEKSNKRILRVDISPEMTKIIDDKELVKSEKFRKLHDLGMPAVQISEIFESHYSFVNGVLKRKEKLLA